MSRRREEPEEEDQEMEEELRSLEFSEQLVPRAGKPIATGELLRRLEKLSKELVDLEQDTVDKDSLTPVAKQLASPSLLSHKEAGVKAFTASCLVDILKLCAPEAPFTPKHLKVCMLRLFFLPADSFLENLSYCVSTVSNLFCSLGYLLPLYQGHPSCPMGSHQYVQHTT